MKLNFIIGLFTLFVLSSCSSNEDSNSNEKEINEVKAIAQSNTWQITSFIDSGNDETNHFSGYSFTFNNDGSITASNGSQTHTGSWSVTNSNSNDDSPNDIHFNILFITPTTFDDDLTEDWNIVSKNNTKIELIHISGGNGGTDTLTFEKIG